MLNFHTQANPSEIIVGWYSSTGEINANSKYINEFYGNEIQRPPIHLCVDVDFKKANISVKAFMANSVVFDKTVIASNFQRIALKLEFTNTERIASGFSFGFCLFFGYLIENIGTVNAISETKEEEEEDQKEEGQVERQVGLVHSTIDKLEEIVGDVQSYLADVCSGKRKASAKVGRKLQKIVSLLSVQKPEVLRSMFNDSIQDLLLVVHLANITQAQLQVAEKIHQML